jgi:hypothetical protein
VIPRSKFISVDGTVVGQDLRDAFDSKFPKGDPLRYFMDSPLHDDGRTWIVTKMWGNDTESVLVLQPHLVILLVILVGALCRCPGVRRSLRLPDVCSCGPHLRWRAVR